MKHQLLCSIFFLFFIGCSTYLDTDLILGNWRTQIWFRLDNLEVIDGKMSFTFSKGGKYKIDYGSDKEDGIYWFAGDYLHSKEDGQSEKAVKIILLSKDSLIIDMNRDGVLERVLLLKQQ